VTFSNFKRLFNERGERDMNSDAIEKLYVAYSRQVYFYTLSLCGNSHLTEDIMQEAFVKAMLSLEASEGNLKAWLFKVCRNLWIDYLRKNAKLSEMELENLQLEDSALNLIDGIIKNEEAKNLYKKMISLPSNLREVLILHYYLELPQSRITEILNISNGAVRTLLYRARIRLKTVIKEDKP